MDKTLVDELVTQLSRKGSARSGPNDDTAAWRATARAAARHLDRPVETIEHAGVAHAALRDWPANELEQQIHQKALRRAVNAASQ